MLKLGWIFSALALAGCAEKSQAGDSFNIAVNTEQCSRNDISEEQQLLCNEFHQGRMNGISAIVDRLGKPRTPPVGSPLALEMLSLLSKARHESELMLFGRAEGGDLRLFEKPDAANSQQAITKVLSDQAYYRTGVLSALTEYCTSDSGKKQSKISCNKPSHFLSITEQVKETQSQSMPWNRK